MLEIYIHGPAAAAFIIHAGRYAVPPVSVLPREDRMLLYGITPDSAAKALAYGAFPVIEQKLLLKLIHKEYPALKGERRRRLLFHTAQAKEQYIPDEPWQGKDGELWLQREYRLILENSGRLDIRGFIGFRMKGYEDYLRRLLDEASNMLEREEEEQRYYAILSRSLTRGKGHVTLFFAEDEICHIRQHSDKGLPRFEGGRFHGAEWLLIANLISLDPEDIRLKDPENASPLLLEMLDKVFGEKIVKNS